MGLMDFFIRPEPVSYGTAKGLNTLQINRIAADLRTARDKVNNQMAKRELLEKQREATVMLLIARKYKGRLYQWENYSLK